MNSSAMVTWEGGLKDGKGRVTAARGAFTDLALSYATRFEGAYEPGTTPEELVAAAHASCFSMALANALGKAGYPPLEIHTTATVTLGVHEDQPTITTSHLTTRAVVPHIDPAQFEHFAQATKLACPISRLMKAEITLEATLEGPR